LKRILFVEGCRDGSVGGSHTCLVRTVASLDRGRYYPIVVFYDNHSVAETLRSAGIEVHILANQSPADLMGSVRRRWPSLVPLSLALRPVQQSYNFGWHFLRPVLQCALRIRRWNADIVHLNNSLNTNHEWMVAGRISGARVISHERGISWNLSRTAARLGRELDRIVCISKATQQPLLQRGFDAAQIRVVYDGVSPEDMRVTQPPDQVRAACGIPPLAPVIGVVGNVKAWKGQEVVIRALSILKDRWPDLRCLLVGSVADHEYKRRLDSVIDELALHRHVVFTGFQKNPSDFLNVMDVVVHASIEAEPFGMVNLEAMCMRKPVISTTIGGPAEVFEHGHDGMLVAPGDPVALAGCLQELLADDALRRRIGSAAYDTVTRRFRLHESVRQIEQIYDEL
jgi:glycosyltransferase involved in cell wall biosynthesis